MTSVAYQVFLHEETIRERLREKKYSDRPILCLPTPVRYEAIYIDPYIDRLNARSVIMIQDKINRMKANKNE